MAPRSKQGEPAKRLNRMVGVAEATGKVLDPVFRKRGFASRDILTHWSAMAPAPYDTIAIPDRLSWPRGGRGAEGATLYLRCAPGHGLALSHEGQRIAAAVNRYFGYLLVAQVRLAAEPFKPGTPPPPATDPLRPETAAEVDSMVQPVDDAGIREALRRLGRAIKGRSQR